MSVRSDDGGGFLPVRSWETSRLGHLSGGRQLLLADAQLFESLPDEESKVHDFPELNSIWFILGDVK